YWDLVWSSPTSTGTTGIFDVTDTYTDIRHNTDIDS
ncbi:hypothetical protein A2U01_0050602, partial [Trifolium medium]|nr:hypothetical protein [Trifolium medium]